MINFIKQKNDMKKLAYIVITSSMFLTTSCVDLTQEPQSLQKKNILHVWI